MRLGPDDRVEVPGEQDLGAQRADPLDGVDHGQRVAVAVAADGDEVGDVAEDRPNVLLHRQIRSSGSQTTSRVGGLPARGGDQLQPAVRRGSRVSVSSTVMSAVALLCGGQLRAEPALDRRDAVGEPAAERERTAVAIR